jgi:hypothetical protein
VAPDLDTPYALGKRDGYYFLATKSHAALGILRELGRRFKWPNCRIQGPLHPLLAQPIHTLWTLSLQLLQIWDEVLNLLGYDRGMFLLCGSGPYYQIANWGSPASPARWWPKTDDKIPEL